MLINKKQSYSIQLPIRFKNLNKSFLSKIKYIRTNVPVYINCIYY